MSKSISKALAAGLVALSCGPSQDPPPRASAPPPPDPRTRLESPLFVEAAAEVGLDFVHENGRTGQFRYCEMMGGGVALLDFDGDDDLDVYLVQGGPLEGEDGPRPVDRLFRNDLDRATGALRFTDVTEAAGLASDGYGMGVLAADLDGDGWTDLYVTQLGPDRWWRNRGDGTFEDATEAAGLVNAHWSVSAAAFDWERDGDLDLWVGNYLEYSVASDKRCTDELGARNYCGPLSFPPVADRLFRNRGDGTFEDVSADAGIDAVFGGALGVLATDMDGDGRTDVYVANDGTPNQFWHDAGDGTFEDRAVLAGCALNGEGRPEAGMGVAGADLDGDGDEDLIVGHLDGETNTTYINDGSGFFDDRSAELGLGAPSFDRTTFGVVWLDADHDGDLDLVTANGAVKVLKELAMAGDPWPLHQPDQLFLHGVNGRWEDVTGSGIGGLSEVGRGAVVGDLDEDGDLDVVVAQNGGPVRFYRSSASERGAWFGLRLLDEDGRLAVDAVATPDGLRSARARRGDSYGSTSDDRLHWGLGDDRGERTVRVRWHDGGVESFGPLGVDTWHVLRRGSGRPEEGS